MDLSTVKQTDFVAYPLEQKLKTRRERPTRKLEMVAKSAYSADFTNWGAVPVSHVKEFYAKLGQLPFKGNSLYRESYRNRGGAGDSLKESSMFSANRDNLRFDGPRNLNSTYASTMKDYSYNKLNVFDRRQTLDLRSVSVSPSHYHTISKCTYRQFGPNLKDPRYLKFALKK